MANAGKKRVKKLTMGVAALGVATSVAGVAATQPASISTSLVDLAALIVVGSSTHPDGSGNEDFFQGKFNAPPYNTTGDDIVHVNFFTGPIGINRALHENAGDAPNAVLASGWGAANASLLLRVLDAKNDPVLGQTVLILDNDVSRPDGGFGTRYPWFALIGVNPLPTPSDSLAAAVVSIGYEYDYNSNAPADVLNPLAAVNSLVAYLYRHLNQAELDLPVNADGSPAVTCASANTCGITDNNVVLSCPDAHCDSVPEGDRVAAYVTKRGNTTYVTYTSNGLPLTNLIREHPFGGPIADLTEPLLKTLVDSAYYHGNPIPADPSRYRPARLVPSPREIVSTATKIPGALQEGLAAATSDEQTQTTSTTLREADDESPAPPKKKHGLLRNVIRESHKAVPGRTGTDTAPSADPEGSESDENSAPENPSAATQPDANGSTTDPDAQDQSVADAGNDAAA